MQTAQRAALNVETIIFGRLQHPLRVRERWLGLSAQPRGLVKWIAGRLIMPLREAAG